MIYLDNAATAFPKPPGVLDEMIQQYARFGGSPGRGGYDLAAEAGELVDRVRDKVADFFMAPESSHVVFANNATDALNLAIQGILQPGDHAVSTRLEHNSVLRPLFHLKEQGWIEYDLAPFDNGGFVDPKELASLIRPNTRLVIVNHASNVLGSVQPLSEVGRLCSERRVPLLIDAAQSAGHIFMDMATWGASVAAFTGHKAMLGPTGIGGLVIAPDLEINMTRFGGTGVDSKSLRHTPTYPHRLETGTLNMLGIMGLSAGLDYLDREGIKKIREQEFALAQRLWEGLTGLKGVTLYGTAPSDNHVPVITCNVDGMAPSDVGDILDGDFDIAVRTGLHCAPLVHTDIGTGDTGAVRFSIGCQNTVDEIDETLKAMARIADRRQP
jgi:cysteine desulfurase/selenocysteine lyase